MPLQTPALDTGRGRPLAEASLAASGRLCVLLQAAALLSHLERVGGRLSEGWVGARVDRRGVLCGVRTTDGSPYAPDHRPMAALLALVFGGEGELSGRGQAWRAARCLGRIWGQRLMTVPADDSVKAILDAAPFLWRPTHAAGRQALLARATMAGKESWLVAGPPPWRRRLLALGGRPAVWRQALAGASGRRCWEAPDEAVARWTEPRDRPSARAPEPAATLFRRGRFGVAERLLRGCSQGPAQLLRVRCLLEGGQLGALRVCLRRLAAGRLTIAERAELDELRSQVPRRVPGSLTTSTAPLCPRRPSPPSAPSIRRRLPPWRAAGRWHQLAHRRLVAADLQGAERALRHATRLLGGCEAPLRHQRLLYELAEVRLRRGRVGGVERLLTSAWCRGPQAGRDRWRRRLLGARLALLGGDIQKALEWLAPMGDGAERRCRAPAEIQRGQAGVLAARALGWLGRPAAARQRLERCRPAALQGLEPEEWPALWALCGDRRRAWETASGSSTESLWHARLDGHRGAAAAWAALAALEPFRAARLVYDLERVEPGLSPHAWRRRAADTLRRVGDDVAAAALESRAAGPWGPVREYLADPLPSAERLRRLFVDAGYVDVRLVWREAGDRRVVVDGPGGAMKLAAPLAEGRLELRSRRLDPVLRTLFVLALRDLRPLEREEDPPDRRGGQATAAGDESPSMIGRSRIFRAALERLRRLAPSSIPIVVRGETGTGKELAAAQVHAWSRRCGGPFLAVNCAALAENLVLSDLFGHARGAFTGADRDRRGVFETASGGTVFLDEIGDLPASAQGLLLRVLQEQEVRRVGENRPRPVDVRVVAATHRHLEAMVAAGKFRGDLYFRLAAGRVELPPLSRRGDDVVMLAEMFVQRVAGERGSPSPAPLSPAVRRRLLEHSWPGNVRELQNVIAVAAALAGEGPIRCVDLELPEGAAGRGADGGPVGVGGDYHQQVRTLRRRLVEDALTASAGNRARAARRLGLSRQALSYLAANLDVG